MPSDVWDITGVKNAKSNYWQNTLRCAETTEGFVNIDIIPIHNEHGLKPKEVLPQQRSGHLVTY